MPNSPDRNNLTGPIETLDRLNKWSDLKLAKRVKGRPSKPELSEITQAFNKQLKEKDSNE